MKNFKKIIKKVDNEIFYGILKKFYQYLYKNFSIFCSKIFVFTYKKKIFFNFCYYDYNDNLLTKLCEKYKSDKGCINHNAKSIWGHTPHTFSNYYYSLFNHFKDDVKLVFECGLGTNNQKIQSNMGPNGKPGASLRVWRNYFKNAQIYGADIDNDILFEEHRIKTYYVDQLKTQTIIQMWKKVRVKNFDIIIDDGLHNSEANLNFFFNSFKKLKKNGIYIIEDVKGSDLKSTMSELKSFNAELIILGKKKLSYSDNNLIVIRND